MFYKLFVNSNFLFFLHFSLIDNANKKFYNNHIWRFTTWLHLAIYDNFSFCNIRWNYIFPNFKIKIWQCYL